MTHDKVYLVTATPGVEELSPGVALLEDVQKNIDLKNAITALAKQEGTTIYIHEYNSGRRRLGVLVECPEDFLEKIQTLPQFHASKETKEKTYRHRAFRPVEANGAPKPRRSIQRKP